LAASSTASSFLRASARILGAASPGVSELDAGGFAIAPLDLDAATFLQTFLDKRNVDPYLGIAER
jgi:hypothetical protein